MIRVDPVTGAALANNPLILSPDLNKRRIVGYGLRNPFRFAIRPGTNDLWIGNVGWITWELIDRIPAPLASTVSNFGWPCYEGPNPQSNYQAANLSACQSLLGSGVTAPYFAYDHASAVVPGEACPTANGSSISGLSFYSGGSYPSAYDGALFFADHTRNCIWTMFPGSNGLPNPATIQTFVTGASNPVDLETGPGGDLFYVDHEGGAIHRVTVESTTAPTARITAVPTAGATPLKVDFDGTGSTDPNPGTLSYAWDLDGNGTFVDSTSPMPSWTYTSPGPVTVGLRVTDLFSGLSGATTILISPGAVAPTVTIDSPASSLTWAVGSTIAFSGHAHDWQGHPIPASGLTWSLILHHCPSACHTHLVQTFDGVASGSFAAPDHEYPAYLELQLTATDSTGLQATRSVSLQPKTVVLSFQTSPVGLALAVGTRPPTTTPFSVTEIKGSAITLTASQAQTLNGVDYAYEGWSDGGVQSHTITASTSATYSATYVFSATYHAVGPTRLLDSRTGNGLSGTFKNHVARTFQVAGRGGVPSGAVAVSGSLTVTGQSAPGYLYLGPDPVNDPTSSTLNFPVGDNRATGVTVALRAGGTPGSLSVTYVASPSTATTQVIFDVTGYFTADATGATYHAVGPTRLLDSRTGNGLSGTFKNHVARTFQVAGRGGVPSGAVAVSGSLTVTGQSAPGYLYLGPDPVNDPTSSTLNFPVGDNRATGVTVALRAGGTPGSLSVTYVASPSTATTQVIFDVTGYFTADATGATYHAVGPTRLLDSRTGNGLSGTFKNHVARTFQVAGRGGVPSGAVAVSGSLTVTGQSAPGYLYLGPDPVNDPTSSTLNFPVGDNRATGVTVALRAGGHAGQPVGHLCGEPLDRHDPGHLRCDRLLPVGIAFEAGPLTTAACGQMNECHRTRIEIRCAQAPMRRVVVRIGTNTYRRNQREVLDGYCRRGPE